VRKGREATLPALLLVSLLLAAGCCHGRFHRQYRTELYFGMSMPGTSATVSAAEWEDFLAREVTPRFPEGFTVVDGRGQWRDSRGEISREASKVLVIIREKDAVSDGKLDDIGMAYKKRFHQESVLRADSPIQVSY